MFLFFVLIGGLTYRRNIQKGEYFLPELVMAGDTMTRVLEILEPILAKGDTPHVGKLLIETVKEETK